MEAHSNPWSQLFGTGPPPIAEADLAGAAPPPPPPPCTSVPRTRACELRYERFCLEYMELNVPLLIEGATEGWAAARDWVAADGSVDLDFLEQRFGDAQVLVTDTARRHEGSGPCERMRLANFLAWWRQHRQHRQQPEQQRESSEVPSEAADEREEPLWYCKDWHLASEFPSYQAYTCPAVFQDDWLNEWFDAQSRRQQDGVQGLQQAEQADGDGQQQRQGPGAGGVQVSDYRFVYLGPAVSRQQGTAGIVGLAAAPSQQPLAPTLLQGTSTPLHADVLRSYSWSANIAGRKLWRLLAPQYTHLLMDKHGRDAAWDFFADESGGEFPGLAEARHHLITLVQQPGEALFVPSGWFHTVENLDDCVSINHNWFNGHNAGWVWALLRRERQQAEAAIEDCRELCSPAEFEGLVQRNLGANAGLDWAGLGALLRCIAEHSLARLAAGQEATATDRAAAEQSAATEQPAAASEQSGAAATEAPSLSAAQQESSLSGRGYHVFRLQRAAYVMQELVAEQHRIDGASCDCTTDVKQPQQEQPAAEQQPAYHAAEVAATIACLERILQHLHAFNLDLL